MMNKEPDATLAQVVVGCLIVCFMWLAAFSAFIAAAAFIVKAIWK